MNAQAALRNIQGMRYGILNDLTFHLKSSYRMLGTHFNSHFISHFLNCLLIHFSHLIRDAFERVVISLFVVITYIKAEIMHFG